MKTSMARVQSYDNLSILRNSMDYSMMRHSVLANNIANIDTPGYKRSDVSFQTELARALEPEKTIQLSHPSPRHFEWGPTRSPGKVLPKVYSEQDTWTRNDKNNVDPEVEMTHVAQNTLYYQTLSGFVAGNFRGLISIVTKSGAV